jgi:diguanylate cyclase (GGDEF)-like protein
MARLLAGCFLLLACLHAAAAPAPATVLRDETGSLDARPLAETWFDARGDAKLAQVLRSADFEPADHEVKLPGHGALWLHLRLARGAGERQDWLLTLPMPLLDLATVYQWDQGQWRAESAGDTLAVDHWAERGRYPFFRLDLPAGAERDVYVRLQHATPAHFPLQLATEAHATQAMELESLGLGLAFGALLLLIASCLAMAWAWRDPSFAWYGGYASITSLAVAAYTGVAAQFLWPGFGLLQDAPTNMLACATVGAAILFVRSTLGLRRRMPWLNRMTLVLGILGPVVAVFGIFLPKAVFLQLMGVYVCVTGVAALSASATAWWRGDTVARWVFAAQFPLVSALILTVTSNLGWIDLPLLSQYLVIVGLAFEVPLLLVALFIRSRDRHGAEVRAQALSTHDALTGLLAPHLFTDRLRQVVARHRRNGENAAIMVIDLVNHAPIREHFGSAAADQSVLRSVIKLRRLLRDVDTVARLGEARFGVILEGASARSSVTERATRLIAAGLMPLPGLKPDVTLQFHVAALLLAERPMEPEAIQDALAERLRRMSPRTRRPIRFLEPEQAEALEESALFPEAAPAEEPERSEPGLAPAP